jgi:hypothetical protein
MDDEWDGIVVNTFSLLLYSPVLLLLTTFSPSAAIRKQVYTLKRPSINQMVVVVANY